VNWADYDDGDANVRVMRVLDLGTEFQVQGVTRADNDES